MARPAVLFGGPSPEHDVSILTGLQAVRALVDAGGEPFPVYWSKAATFHLVAPTAEAADFLEGVPRDATPLELVVGTGGGFVTGGRLGRRRRLDTDAVLNCCHGGPGEDGRLQGLLDLAGIPYTGPSAAGAALGMDKLAFRGVVAADGLPTLPCAPLDADTPSVPFEPPFIVKPRWGGSSIGVHADVADLETARALVRTQPALRSGAVIEPYVPAVDLNICVRTWPETELSAIERPLRAPDGRVYTYAEKYLGGGGLATAARELPADIPPQTAEHIRSVARRIAELAAVRGVARIDFLWDADGGHVWVNEINTVPGALGWYFWTERGIPVARFLEDLLTEARRRPAAHLSADGADGSALRAAGSIASKLA